MGRIANYIKEWQARRDANVLNDNGALRVLGGYGCEPRLPFADTMFYNICDLLTDISAEVIWTRTGGDVRLFAAWRAFYDTWSKFVLNVLFEKGYCVIGEKNGFFEVLAHDKYRRITDHDETRVVALDESVTIYVMKSQTYILHGCSDKQLLRPYLEYLDNVLNASNTVCARLGAMVVMSPQSAPAAPSVSPLLDTQRKQLEEDMSKGYGALSKQKQVLLLSRPMNAQVINLAGVDTKSTDKAKLAILAICDRIKVPANQVAIIDSNSSKSLSNGTELREGDLAKYRSFRRLLNVTWWQMAQDLGLQVDYTIENEPKTTQGDTIEQ